MLEKTMKGDHLLEYKSKMRTLDFVQGGYGI